MRRPDWFLEGSMELSAVVYEQVYALLIVRYSLHVLASVHPEKTRNTVYSGARA